MSGCRTSAFRRLGTAACLAAGLLAPFGQGTALAQGAVLQPPDSVPEALVDTLAAVTGRPDLNPQAEPARVWLASMQQRLAPFVPDPEVRLALLEQVRLEAALAGLPPAIVLAVIQVESGFDVQARSSAGALGLMQVMPFWKQAIGRAHDDLFETGLNLRYGCTILAYYLRLEKGDLTRALARYNGSLGQTWYPERVMRAWQEHWR